MATALQSTSLLHGTRQAKYTHPTYGLFAPVWRRLMDVREGVGGFLDGTYLVPHPREYKDHTSDSPSLPTKKLRLRRELACYENFAGTILDSMKSALFREQPTRRIGDGAVIGESRIKQWWENVDGLGTHIDDFMPQVWDLAATFGHVHLFADRSDEDPTVPMVRVYTPLDALDWLTDANGKVIGLKFVEVAERKSLSDIARPMTRTRIVTTERWELYNEKGALIDGDNHEMGVLPVVTLFGKRRTLDRDIGQSILGDPKLFIDVYNLTSEVRELLRSQTFSILNVPLGTGPDAMTIEQAQTLAGSTTGTSNALFSGLPAQFISADAANVVAYHSEIQRRLRTIYRLVSLTWEADSKDAEAEGSLKLKREDMNQRLAGYADECERAEYALAHLFYRTLYGADQGPKKMEAEQVTIKYPDTFDMTPFDDMIAQADAARDLGLPAPFLKELRKQLVRKFHGFADMPPSKLEEIDTAIDGAPDDLTPDERMQQRVGAMATALRGVR